jgi:signal peptidase II
MFAAEKSIGLTVFFLVISVVAIGIIIYLYFFSSSNLLKQSALILILGGAAGNLIDRVRLQEVIDFIDLHWYQYHWPAFNIADTCITIGVGLFIWDSLFTRDK